jgi:hypothetical protein
LCCRQRPQAAQSGGEAAVSHCSNKHARTRACATAAQPRTSRKPVRVTPPIVRTRGPTCVVRGGACSVKAQQASGARARSNTHVAGRLVPQLALALHAPPLARKRRAGRDERRQRQRLRGQLSRALRQLLNLPLAALQLPHAQAGRHAAGEQQQQRARARGAAAASLRRRQRRSSQTASRNAAAPAARCRRQPARTRRERRRCRSVRRVRYAGAAQRASSTRRARAASEHLSAGALLLAARRLRLPRTRRPAHSRCHGFKERRRLIRRRHLRDVAVLMSWPARGAAAPLLLPAARQSPAALFL